jgi:signal transduction histidine kinase
MIIKKETKILIIEDNIINVRILLEQLKIHGYKTLIAENGEVGIKRAIFAQPDLILLDIMMPGIDGYETCRKLKENQKTKDIPIIFVTALTATKSRIKGFKYGAVDYVTKPFQQEEVLARIQTHLTLQEQKKKLEELNRTKDTFFSIIAHDLRGAFMPLVGSVSILEKLIKHYDDQKLQKFSNNISVSIKNIHKLLDNLLCWGRIQRQQLSANPKDVNLFKLMEWLTDLYQEQAHQKNIKLVHTIPPELVVWADSNMIETIFRNLITNAIKFTSSDGTVSITNGRENKHIIISVKDTGIGIAKERLSGIFKTDVKNKTKGTAGEKGTGLGLILCDEFVKLNNGWITVDSKINQGTTFCVYLPERNPHQ